MENKFGPKLKAALRVPREQLPPQIGLDDLRKAAKSVRETTDPNELIAILKDLLKDKYKILEKKATSGLTISWYNLDEEWMPFLRRTLNILDNAGVEIQQNLSNEERDWLMVARKELTEYENNFE